MKLKNVDQSTALLERFRGPEGRRLLIETFQRQQVAANKEEIATALADIAELVPVKLGAELIRQGHADNDLYLILAGKVSVQIHGREVATRQAGQTVGEMATIDPSVVRSASVIATEPSVVAKVAESDFTKLAQQFPCLWRRLAIEIAERLRLRSTLVGAKNEKPIVFVGSSSEARSVAWEIRDGLHRDDMSVNVWTDGVFHASSTVVDDLLDQVSRADFAILLLTADDTVRSRRRQSEAPRDNCIFELGLFMGALGRDRTFIVKPRGVDLKLPSDLLGLTPLEYQPGPESDLHVSLGPVCNAIRKTVAAKGAK
jgi:predicted nucleotide-binding protein